MDPQLRAQTLSLLGGIIYHFIVVCFKLPYYVLRNLLAGPEKPDGAQNSVVFYEGTVSHVRRAPKKHSLRQATEYAAQGLVGKVGLHVDYHTCALPMRACRYSVRTALISLDNPPAWFSASAQARDHMTADVARAYAGTDGERSWAARYAHTGRLQACSIPCHSTC